MSGDRLYYRPLVQVGPGRPARAKPLAGGWGWFTDVEVLARGKAPRIAAADDIPRDVLDRLTTPREALAGLTLDRPRVMGILNVTPDSFSDGGLNAATKDAVAAGQAMRDAGVDVIDIGGESTRPGAETIDPEVEAARVVPVIKGLRAAGVDTLLSLDTRKASVGQAGVLAGAGLINDVSGFTYDPALADVARAHDLPVCVMHAQGDPVTMQVNPTYEDVLLDVYDALERQIATLTARGLARGRILADPGIGFGKTMEHNLDLLARVSLFHALGVPLLLGASRKRFIGTIGQAPAAHDRLGGSLAVALAGLAQGIQMVRVHDVAETCQAIALWRAVTEGKVQ